MALSEAATVERFLDHAARRAAWRAALYGAAAGFVLAAVAARAGGAATWLAPTGALVAWLGSRRHWARTAALVELRAPQCRNVLVTAADLSRGAVTAPADIVSVVYRDAAQVVARISLDRIVPLRLALVTLVASVGLWLLAVLSASVTPAASHLAPARDTGRAAIRSVEIAVVPPAYAERDSVVLRDPARVEAFEGSALRVTVLANAERVALETVNAQRWLALGAGGAFVGVEVADADGYLAVVAIGPAGDTARGLIGLTVTADRRPHVRLTVPGRDVFIDSVRGVLEVALEAEDDVALASLALRYTKVSGSGEQFTFVDGEVPLHVIRKDERLWTARGALPLPALSLDRGDIVVYRGVAADKRPGAAPGESDAFIVELAAAGAPVTGGFSIDDDYDRYGVSQQMVILMTERLLARRQTLSAEEFVREAQTLAAAQRRVRAEFVFMLGGELTEDMSEAAGVLELHEEAHRAADEDEAIAGRLANQGRLDLLRAIRAMSRAAAALNAADPARALPDARDALANLQRAFSRTKYILRTLTERERIDLSRRLTGSLSSAVGDRRPTEMGTLDTRTVALRQALAVIATLAASEEWSADVGARATKLAQHLLQVDASSTVVREAAAHLSAAAAGVAWADVDAARTHLDRAALKLVVALRAQLREAPRAPLPIEDRALAGALADALRARGTSRR